MSIPMTRNCVIEACRNMEDFYTGLSNYYKTFGLDIESNRGRRNILMSEPMEIFLAKELAKLHDDVIVDGRTGKADIVIRSGNEEKEIECKLTSPHLSSGSIAFQTDFESLEKKKSLDYIYIIANEDFSGFCAIYFEGLTTDDFRPLSPGARGKVQMYKHKGMKKATILLGGAIDLNLNSINNSKNKLEIYKNEASKKIDYYNKKINQLKSSQVYDNNKLNISIEKIENDLSEKINKFDKEIIIKKGRVSRYTFKFESLMEK